MENLEQLKEDSSILQSHIVLKLSYSDFYEEVYKNAFITDGSQLYNTKGQKLVNIRIKTAMFSFSAKDVPLDNYWKDPKIRMKANVIENIYKEVYLKSH